VGEGEQTKTQNKKQFQTSKEADMKKEIILKKFFTVSWTPLVPETQCF